MPELIKRHFDYVVNLGTLTPSQLKTGIPFTLDSDADFVLVSRVYRIVTPVVAGPLVSMLSERITDAQQQYLSQRVMPFATDFGSAGTLGNPIPMQTPLFFPRSSAVNFDVLNTSTVQTLTGVTCILRGYKLYPEGRVVNYEYPDGFRPLPYKYTNQTANTSGSLVYPTVAVTQGTGLLVPFTVQPDAGFVMRGGQCCSLESLGTATPTYNELFMRLFDEQQKPYSNAPVPIDVMFGAGGAAQGGSAALAGPAHPGLFTPEIYLPRNHQIYWELSRDDSGYAGQVPLSIAIVFEGMKCFPV